MHIKLSQLKLMIKESLAQLSQEDVERLNRSNDDADAECGDEFEEAAVGTLDPRLAPKPAGASAALHTRDKSQMQGVGPRPSMSNAFDQLNQMPQLQPKKEAHVPTDKEEDFVKANKEDFKKRYGAKYKDVLYATAKKKFGEKK